MAKNDEERAQLSSARGFGSTISSLVPVMTAPLILSYFGDTNPTAYMVCSVVFAAVGFVMCLLHCMWTEERSEPVATSQSDADKIKITDILGVFKNNRAFLALCVHSVCITTNQAVATSLGTYMYSDVLGNLALMSLSSLLSMPFAFFFLAIAPKLATMRRSSSSSTPANISGPPMSGICSTSAPMAATRAARMVRITKAW